MGGKVTGIGQTQHEEIPQVLESRCTQGRFQLGFAQPVYVGSNEAQEGPPDGAPVGSSHSITFYSRQLAEGSSEGKPFPYNYAVGHLGDEVGHRWSAYVSAKVNMDVHRSFFCPGGLALMRQPAPYFKPDCQLRSAAVRCMLSVGL